MYNNYPIDPYYIGIVVFGTLSIIFSFGNIENSKWVQIVTTYLRLIAILLMYIGTIYYLGKDGTQAAPLTDFNTQI